MERIESASLPERGHLSMKGKIRTLEKCPKCRCTFKPDIHPHTKDVIYLRCPTCGTRPAYYYIDARAFKMDKIYLDKRGEKFDSFSAVYRQLTVMREQDDRHELDPSEWMPKKRKEFRFTKEVNGWIEKMKIDKSYSYVRHCNSYMQNHIIPLFGDMDVRDIRPSHLEDLYYKLIEKKLEPKTIDDIISTMETFMRRLHRLQIIPKLPVFPVVTVPEKHKGWINAEKQALVLSCIPDRADDKKIIRTLLETAERPGEVCAHKTKDLIDVELVIERAFDEKGNLKPLKAGKIIYRGLSLDLWNELVAHAKDTQPEAWLFLDKSGAPYTQGLLYDIWCRAVKKAGLPHISLYAGTRRSRASQKRLEMEKKIAEACRQELSHGSSATTMKHYARSRKEEIK